MNYEDHVNYVEEKQVESGLNYEDCVYYMDYVDYVE